MSKIDDYTRLCHIKDAANEALFFIQGKSREFLNTDRILVLSLIHNYYEVDLDILWKTMTEDLPFLLNILEDHI